ncbi:MAG: hypothetical protein KA003_07065 [Caldilineaceae bacterium]|nr:hypothetical protein [Caldilineaceae bacterium]
MTTSQTPSTQNLKTDLAFCISPDNSRYSSIRIVEPRPEDAHANRGNLYVLVDLLSEEPGQGGILRQMLNTIQQIYYTASGSQSSVLAQAITAANSQIRQDNMAQRGRDGAEVRAGIACVALLRNQLTVASAGPCLVILAAGNSVDQVSPDAEDFSAPLGGISDPEVSVSRHTVGPGDVIFLGESDWLMRLPLEALAKVLARTAPDNRFDVVDYLRQQSSPAEILGLLVTLSDPATVAPSPALIPNPQSLQPATPSRRPNRGLPTASVGASPPVRDVPPAPSPRRDTPPSLADAARRAARPQPDPGPRGGDRDREGYLERAGVDAPVNRSADRGTQAAESRDSSAGGGGAALAGAAQQGGRWLKGLITRMLPDKESAPAPRSGQGNFIPSRPQRPQLTQPGLPQPDTAPEAQPPRPSPVEMAAEAVAQFEPPPKAKGGRARLFVSLAVLVLVLTVIGVATIYLRGASNREDAENLVLLVKANLVQAQGLIDAGQEATARDLLTDAQGYLQQAALIVGNTAQISDLGAELEKELQSVMQIYLLYGLDIPLERFTSGDPQEVVVADQDVYILDTGRQVIEHLRLDAQREVVEERTGVILREGDNVGGVTVGRLVDVTWQPRITGFADKPSLLILDRNNHVFRYNRVDGASLLTFAGQNEWQVPMQLAVYGDGWVYMADQGSQQIYKYEPSGNGYEAPPTLWFAPGSTVNLTGLRTMRIDGDVWLLYENGQILRYFGGEQVAFALENNVGQVEDPRELIVTSTRLYLADAAGARVLVYSRENGSYLHQFQAADASLLRGLRSVFVDEGTGKIFLLTQAGLYQQTLPR